MNNFCFRHDGTEIILILNHCCRRSPSLQINHNSRRITMRQGEIIFLAALQASLLAVRCNDNFEKQSHFNSHSHVHKRWLSLYILTAVLNTKIISAFVVISWKWHVNVNCNFSTFKTRFKLSNIVNIIVHYSIVYTTVNHILLVNF